MGQWRIILTCSNELIFLWLKRLMMLKWLLRKFKLMWEEGLGELEADMRTIKAVKEVTEGSKKEIAKLKSMLIICEKDMQELQCFKISIVCGLGMFVGYCGAIWSADRFGAWTDADYGGSLSRDF